MQLLYLWLAQVPSNMSCLEATIFHNLPVITSHEMMVLLEAIHEFTATGAGCHWRYSSFTTFIAYLSFAIIVLIISGITSFIFGCFTFFFCLDLRPEKSGSSN